MNLLLFFAFPISTIILSVVLEKVLKNPVLVALTFFAIYLIVTFASFNSDFLINTIIYTIIAYIAAALTKIICNFIKKYVCSHNNIPESESINDQDGSINSNLCQNNTCKMLYENVDFNRNNNEYKYQGRKMRR